MQEVNEVTKPRKEGDDEVVFTQQDMESYIKLYLSMRKPNEGITRQNLFHTIIREVRREADRKVDEQPFGESHRNAEREIDGVGLIPYVGTTQNDVTIYTGEGETSERVVFGSNDVIEEATSLIKFMNAHTDAEWLLTHGKAPYGFIPSTLGMYRPETLYEIFNKGRVIFAAIIASRILNMMGENKIVMMYKGEEVDIAQMCMRYVVKYQDFIINKFSRASTFKAPDLVRDIPGKVLFEQYIVTYYRLLTYIFDLMTLGRKDKNIDMYLMPNEYFISYFSREGTTSDRLFTLNRSIVNAVKEFPKDSFWVLFPDGEKHMFLELYPTYYSIDG